MRERLECRPNHPLSPLQGRLCSLLTALIFAAHPVHSEVRRYLTNIPSVKFTNVVMQAVQNITGRAEVLMALFFLSGFTIYASLVRSEGASSSHSSTYLVEKSESM